jgi:hypothetical protein
MNERPLFNTPPAPPIMRCFDCGNLHAGNWIRCPSCESIFQQEQKLFRGAA